MRFQALYDRILKDVTVVVRIHDNVLPRKGYAVFMEGNRRVYSNGPHEFDEKVEEILDLAYEGKWEYLMFSGGNMRPVHVFSSREYAIGFATGRGYPVVFDLAKQQWLHLRGVE
jgi:hypothetical protein